MCLLQIHITCTLNDPDYHTANKSYLERASVNSTLSKIIDISVINSES